VGEVGSYPYDTDICMDALSDPRNSTMQAWISSHGWKDTCLAAVHITRWTRVVLAKPRNIAESICKKHGLLSVMIWERKSEFSRNFGMVGAVTASHLSPGGEWEGERQQEEQGHAQPAQVEI